MHSGSSISPKHPAIPVSIGIASLVLEGRSSALDDSSIHVSSSASHGSGGGSGGDAGSGGEGGVGGAEGSSNGGGTGADEDGGFYGKKRPSSSSTSSSSSGSAASAGSSGGSSGGTTSANACTLQQCSLLAITEAHKMANANAAASCHMSDASQRINLKLQQIRSSCPGTSKDEVHHLVTVSGGEPGSGRGRASLDEDERQYGGMMYGVESFVNVASSGRFGGGSSTASACWAHESGPSAAQSPPHPSAVIYSGFEKMNVLGTVSPIKNHPIGNSFINFSSSPNSSLVAATAAAAAAAAATVSSSASRKATCSSSSGKQQQQQQHQQQQRPREGPHCEQFLKKIGLNKPDASDGPEHCCSYRNKYCLRWQVYFKQLSSILTNGEAVCIEVYLGPENHTILLEQWILKLVMTKSPTTMTLQSLCAAIRSQLYFSQISAWTDLIKNSLEPDIFNHPRIKKLPPSISPKHGASAAGKVAFLPQAKLDILFRIRTYDNTACFNEKPLVHNFPDANVADGFVIQVCLKSLPRLDRIPGIHAALDAAKMIGATGTAGMLPGDRLDLPCHEKGKHRCAFRELELDEDDEGEVDDPRMADGDEGTAGMLLTSAAINHREKQLLKYKKRMLKREKKKKSSGSGSVAADVAANGEACGSSNSSSSISSSSRSGAGNRNGSSVDSSAYASPMSYSSCSNGSGSGGGGVGGVRNSKSPSVGPYECGAVGNGTATTVYASVSTGGSCTNGSCHSALTSSINSIQPPLYSSNHAHQHSNNNAMMVCCEDRYHTIATSSKSTQTSCAGLPASTTGGALSFVSSVATQTDCGGAISAIGYCTDCCLSRERKHAVDTTPQGSGNHAQRAGQSSNGTPMATVLLQRDAEIVLGTGGGSSSSTNSDRHMQYFNDYYRSYDIINENCDKRHPTPQPADSQRAHHRVADAPMETSTTTIGTEVGADTASGSGTRRRACFIVGGDGYEGDEDEGDAEANGGERSMPNGGDERPLQKGDLLLQAIQRTATLNGGSTQNGSFARSSNYSRPLEDESGPQKHQQRDVVGGYALNNNNYVTANNNNIGECYKGRMDSNGAVAAAALGGEQKANGELDGRKEPNGIVEGGNVEHHHHHQHAAGGSGNGGGGSLGPSAKCERSECDTFSKEKLDLGDCRLCKRQKTKHNFKLNLTNLLSSAVSSAVPSLKAASGRESAAKKTVITTVVDCGSTPPGCRRTLSESLVGHLTIPGCSGGSGANGAMTEAGGGCGSRGMGAGETSNGLYPNGGDLSPGDSPMMLSSSTGAVGNGGVFTFEQMKSYRRAFSEDVIDTITTTTTANGSGRCLGNGRVNIVHTATEDSTEDDDTSGDNENEHELDARERGPKRCGCASSPLPVEHRMVQGQTAHHRQHTSTPATGNGGKCKEPLYISCSETDCSVSTASSVSPHKKQILSCAAIGAGSGSRALDAGRPAGSPGGAPNVQQLMQYKSSPKINLNYVFCLSPLARDDSGFTSGSSPATSTSFPATSPIAIDGSGGIAGGIGGGAGCFGAGTKGGRSQHGGSSSLFRYDFEESPISPVSGTIKSKSAPAFPFSPPAGALSPRFLRNAQQQRLNRTRYPSERSSVSERSSIGSDEQLSDDDLSYLLDSSNGYSPLSGHQMALMGGLPVKMGQATRSSGLLASSQMLSKVLNRNLFKFGRAPLLGTLEESLLQRRLSPKFQVADFKVLLGASGSFCPTQLTIPVASYFYELPGQHLTTPYVCELRLPRKGYSIPRSGTVQATLLNPLGTVVRMFVVPYDFRDMPAMSTTFIRQRILACDESSLQLLGKNIEQLSNAEQMKLLRYAIHLRFQTSRSGKLSLHTDIRLLISRRTDCDTAAAHAKNLLESPNELKVVTIVPENPKFSLRIDKQ